MALIASLNVRAPVSKIDELKKHIRCSVQQMPESPNRAVNTGIVAWGWEVEERKQPAKDQKKKKKK